MLSRYQMKRGVKKELLPQGLRQDTRKHTRHILRPPAALVTEYLSQPTQMSWQTFSLEYLACIQKRFAESPAAFDGLADLAREQDVFLGCSCPTAANPQVNHCHTWLALEFMQAQYADIDVTFPELGTP